MRNTVIAQTIIVTLVAAVLAGCGAPTPGADMAVRSSKSASKLQSTKVATATVATAKSAAMDLDEELESFDVLATGTPGFSVLALKAAPGKQNALIQKVKLAQKGELAARIGRRDADRRAGLLLLLRQKVDLAQRAQQLKAIPWVDNGDGTKTKKGTITSARKEGGVMTITIDLTVDTATNMVVHSLITRSGKSADGGTMDTRREKSLKEDGSYVVVLHSETHGAKGASLVMDGTRSVSANDQLAGSLSITATDAKGAVRAETFTISGTIKHPVVKRKPAPRPIAAPPVAIDVPAADPEAEVEAAEIEDLAII